MNQTRTKCKMKTDGLIVSRMGSNRETVAKWIGDNYEGL